MRAVWRPLIFALSSTVIVMLLTACGINNPGYLTGDGAAVSIKLTGPATVMLGAQSQYAAEVSGSLNASVTWSVNGVAGGNAQTGSISSKGLYTAPAAAPQASAITITATSVASPTVSQSLSVTLASPLSGASGAGVTLALSGASTVTLGSSSQYTATVSGSSNQGVAWSVNGVAGGNATVGSITDSGLYVAPAAAPPSSAVTITATSLANSSVSQSLSVALTIPPPQPANGGTTATVTVSGPASVTLADTAQYTATVSGAGSQAVAWSVDGIAGGNEAVGAITASGLYTAPAAAPQSSAITITATSVADPSASQSLSVALTAPQNTQADTVTLALSGATSVTLGASEQYHATVTGTSDKSVLWSVNGVIGGDASVGTISTAGRYTAPAKAPTSGKVTITATSQADPTVSQSLIITLTAPPQPPKVTVTLSGATSVALGATVQYTATVTGASNTGVSWSVEGVVGGDASVGTISAAGRYTAPGKLPESSKVTITAASAADSSASQSLSVTLTTPPPAIALTLSGASQVTLGGTSQYTATVTGASNKSVAWSVNGVTGGNATNGSISSSGLYTAPAKAPQPSTVTIAATSAADTSIAKSLVVTLVASSASRIPASAVASADLNAATNWQWGHDAGTPGSSQGSTSYPVAGISSDNKAREFYMTYTSHGGEIYHVSFGSDQKATHFVYDTYVYVVDPSQLQNLEMDMNHVMPDGRTIILGMQCSSVSNTWEYVYVSGGHPHWRPSNLACNPLSWSAKTWHHIQIASHHDSSGNATYDWVSIDGKYGDFQNATVADALSLGWAKGSMLINFQIDGESKTSGSNTIYTDKLIVWRW